MCKETFKWFSPETMTLSKFHLNTSLFRYGNRKYAKSNEKSLETIIRASSMDV